MEPCRHCEEQSDEAIHSYFAATWIASLALAMTLLGHVTPTPPWPAVAATTLARRLEPLFGQQPHRGVGVHRLAEREALGVFTPQLIKLDRV